MLPMRLFGSRPFAAGNAAIFFMWGSVLGAVFFLAQFLRIALHYSPLAAGIRLMPWGAAVFVAAPIAGARIRRAGERPFITGGLALAAASTAWLAPGTSRPAVSAATAASRQRTEADAPGPA